MIHSAYWRESFLLISLVRAGGRDASAYLVDHATDTEIFEYIDRWHGARTWAISSVQVLSEDLFEMLRDRYAANNSLIEGEG
jgi:hypothetical protein